MLLNEELGSKRQEVIQQHSGCRASKLETIGAQQMTNKSVEETSILTHIFMNRTRVSAQPRSFCFPFRRHVVKESNYCHSTDIYVSFIETWPRRVPLFYNGCGGMWQRDDSQLLLTCCVHIEGRGYDHTVKRSKLSDRILPNKTSLFSFNSPGGPDTCVIH